MKPFEERTLICGSGSCSQRLSLFIIIVLFDLWLTKSFPRKMSPHSTLLHSKLFCWSFFPTSHVVWRSAFLPLWEFLSGPAVCGWLTLSSRKPFGYFVPSPVTLYHDDHHLNSSGWKKSHCKWHKIGDFSHIQMSRVNITLSKIHHFPNLNSRILRKQNKTKQNYNNPLFQSEIRNQCPS